MRLQNRVGPEWRVGMIAPLQPLGRIDQALLLRAQWRVLTLGFRWSISLNFIAGALMAIIFSQVFGIAEAPIWFGALAASIALRIASVKIYGRKAVLNRRPDAARGWVLAAIAVNGAVWSLGAFLLIAPSAAATIAVYCFFVGGMTAGAAASLSAAPLAFGAFAAPMLIGATLRLALLGDPLSYLLATVSAVFAIGMAGVAHNSQRQIERALRLWLSNRRLRLDLLRAQAEAIYADQRASASDRDRQAALAAAETKTRFLAEVGHELKTPLNAVIGFSDMLADEFFGAIGNPKYQEYANDIRVSSLHLRHLVDGLLDLTLTEQPNWRAKPESVLVEHAAQRIVRELALADQALALRLVIDVEPADLRVEADPRLLHQIVRNLVENALKYAASDGEVRIEGRVSAAGEVQISIHDNGPPIPETALARIMAPFEQAEDDVHRRDGIGLGLALAQQFAELHQGQVSIRNTPEGGVIAQAVLPQHAAPATEQDDNRQRPETPD